MSTLRNPRRRPETLTGLLKQRALKHPGGVHMIIPGLQPGTDSYVTYKEVQDRARAVAAHLELETDASTGDRVLLAGLAGLDYVAGLMGTMLAGCIPVPAPPPFGADLTGRCKEIISDCEPSRVLVTGGLEGIVRDGLDEVFPAGPVDYITVLPDAPAGWEPSVTPGPQDTAYLQYTSGTSGTPRGAVITHAAACAGLSMTAAHMRLKPGDKSASWLPPWHDLGLTALMLALHGRSPCLVTQPMDWVNNPVGWLAEISRRQVEVTPLPSFAFTATVKRLERATADDKAAIDLARLRVAWTGADQADPEGISVFSDVLAGHGLKGDPARWLYGCAEAVGAISGEPLDEPGRPVIADPGWLAEGKIVRGTAESGIWLQTAGRPLRRTRVRVRRLDGGGWCAPGEIGELVMQGPQLAREYWRGTGPWTVIGGEQWMSIGDLGAVLENHQGVEDDTVVVLGRCADVLTLRKDWPATRRYWPSLIEQTAARVAGQGVLPHRIAAVQDVDGEVVIIAEARGNPGETVAASIRGAVVREHRGLVLADVIFVKPKTIPVGTSGKIRRAELGKAYRSPEGLGDARVSSLRAVS